MEQLKQQIEDYEVLDFCYDLLAKEFNLPNSRARLIFKELCPYSKEGQKSFLIKRYKKRIEEHFNITILNNSVSSFREKNNTILLEVWGVYDEKSKSTTHIKKILSTNTQDVREHKIITESYLILNNLYVIDNSFNYIYYSKEDDKQIIKYLED